jgi:hypothetical protein
MAAVEMKRERSSLSMVTFLEAFFTQTIQQALEGADVCANRPVRPDDLHFLSFAYLCHVSILRLLPLV